MKYWNKWNRFSYKVFPFAPGLVWKVEEENFIIPQLQFNQLSPHLKDKEFIILCDGGFLETFFSLSILEMLNIYFPLQKKYLSSKFSSLAVANGIAKPIDKCIPDETLRRYTTPLFFDRDNRAYFNCLYNYRYRQPFLGGKNKRDYRPVIRQICEKVLIPWNLDYLPRFRNLNSNHINNSFKLAKMHTNQPYVLIIPERTSFSQYKNAGLRWNPSQVKSLAAMLKQQLSWNTVILSNCPESYRDSPALVLPFSIENYLILAQTSSVILSEDIDYILTGLVLSKGLVICRNQCGDLGIRKNTRYLKQYDRQFLTYRRMQPLDVLNFIQGTINGESNI